MQFYKQMAGLGDQAPIVVYGQSTGAFGGQCPAGWSYVQTGMRDIPGSKYNSATGRFPQETVGMCIPPPAQVQQQAPANVTVNPTIQTQVSPQVSPVFQQAFQPQDSPMSAGTTQTMPTKQGSGAESTSTVTPPAQGPNYSDILASQQRMLEIMMARATQPVAQLAPQVQIPPTQMAPVPSAPQMEMPQMTPFPIDTAAQSQQTSPEIALQKQNYMPIILVIAGVGILALASQRKKRHAAK